MNSRKTFSPFLYIFFHLSRALSRILLCSYHHLSSTFVFIPFPSWPFCFSLFFTSWFLSCHLLWDISPMDAWQVLSSEMASERRLNSSSPLSDTERLLGWLDYVSLHFLSTCNSSWVASDMLWFISCGISSGFLWTWISQLSKGVFLSKFQWKLRCILECSFVFLSYPLSSG